jgi:hypothetical protein
MIGPPCEQRRCFLAVFVVRFVRQHVVNVKLDRVRECGTGVWVSN